MYAASVAFEEQIIGGQYKVRNRVDVDPGSGLGVVSLPAEMGTFTVDRNAANRRTCQITLTMDPVTAATYMPTDAGDLLTPFGTLLRPYSGIVLPSGNGSTVPAGGTEWVPMGVYVLTDAEFDISSSGDVTALLSGSDLSWQVGNRRFQNPYQVSSNVPQTAMNALLSAVVPGSPPFAIDAGTATLPTPLPTFKEGDDPWSAILTIVDSIGYEAFYDLIGNPTSRPIPNPSGVAPKWYFADGAQGVTSAKRKWTRTSVSNDFTVTSSSSAVQPPVRYREQDTSPTSPTYVGGKFGDVPTFVQNSLVTSTLQAAVAALKLLNASLGSAEMLTWTCLPNPTWDIDDVASVQNTALNIDGTYVVDTITHVFDAKADTSLTGRRVA